MHKLKGSLETFSSMQVCACVRDAGMSPRSQRAHHADTHHSAISNAAEAPTPRKQSSSACAPKPQHGALNLYTRQDEHGFDYVVVIICIV